MFCSFHLLSEFVIRELTVDHLFITGPYKSILLIQEDRSRTAVRERSAI